MLTGGEIIALAISQYLNGSSMVASPFSERDRRAQAYELIKAEHPDSLCWLEIARIAAWMGSDLGSVAASLVSDGDNVGLKCMVNMEDAENARFLEKLREYMASGAPVNRNDIAPHFEAGRFGSVPDLSRYEMIKPKSELTYLASLLWPVA